MVNCELKANELGIRFFFTLSVVCIELTLKVTMSRINRYRLNIHKTNYILNVVPGILKIHSQLQRNLGFVLPCVVLEPDKRHDYYRLSSNPAYSIRSSVFLRNVMMGTILLLLLISQWMLIWLVFTWQYKSKNMGELTVYSVTTCLTVIGLAACKNLQKHHDGYQYVLTTLFRLVKGIQGHLKTSENKKNVGILFVYMFAITFLIFPLLVLSVPFKLDYDPLQLLASVFMGESTLIVKTSISLVYLMIACYAASIMFELLLIMLLILDRINILSCEFKGANAALPPKYFDRCLHFFRQTQILIFVFSSHSSDFIFLIVFMGEILAGFCGYATIVMYDDLPIVTFLACPTIVLLIFTCSHVFIKYSCIPNKNGRSFKERFWPRQFLPKSYEMKQLLSCPQIGYRIGPKELIKMYTELEIYSAILFCTANLVLMGMEHF